MAGAKVVVYGLSTEGYAIASQMAIKGADVSIIDESTPSAISLKAEIAKTYPNVSSLKEDEPLLAMEPIDVAISKAQYLFFTPRIRKTGQDIKTEIHSKFKDAVTSLKKNSSVIFTLATGFGGNNENISFLNMSTKKIDSLLVKHDLDLWDESISINLNSPFYFAKLLIPLMINNKWGRFMFVTSTGGMRGDIGTVSYSASKVGLLGLSRVICKEYSKFNITSNVISLGTFDTGLFHNLSEKKRKEILETIPSKSTGNIDNIVNAVDFIVKSDYVNGSIINIDGGM